MISTRSIVSRHADGTGKLVVSTFESECRGAGRSKRLPISQEIARLAAERIAELPEPMRWFFTHEPGDDLRELARTDLVADVQLSGSRARRAENPPAAWGAGGSTWLRAETAAIETALEGGGGVSLVSRI